MTTATSQRHRRVAFSDGAASRIALSVLAGLVALLIAYAVIGAAL